MKKYWLIIRNTWDEYLVYRLNFVLWRVRVIIRFLITYFLWSSIYTGTQPYFGYTRETMLTYVLMVYLVSNFVFATRTQDVGSEINEGKLTNYLLKPINYFASLASRDISDKLLNFGCTIVELIAIFILLKPQFIFQTNPVVLILVLMAFVGGIVIYFMVSLLLSFIGFWTTEVWVTRFIFIILIDFLAGNFFPIDILPPVILRILLLTPLPYIYYFPVKLYLGNLTVFSIFQGFTVLVFWTLLLIFLVSFVWKKGLRVYSAEGR